MKRLVLAVIVLCIFVSGVCFAQEWSRSQQGVWKVIEKRWDSLAKKNSKGFVSDFHPEFKGFVNWRSLPIDKTLLAEAGNFFMQGYDILFYAIEPVSIVIKDNAAVVHYFCNKT